MSKSEPFRFRLDNATGVPVYRQLIDQVQLAIASGTLLGGDQLPTVRQVAVDLAINPNTVMRAYRELEIRGTLSTQQGLGTFVSLNRVERDQVQHETRLSRLAAECAARAGSEGFSVRELIGRLTELLPDNEPET
ncbi:GntR family transcriptional regulator [uncultured Paludibaculum sp.]|uniref:GntR family transcriptional regulator n=1 Tax=uncultured Paludibaculum sp. TaxID=1765020 RepID=UPI002AAC3C76|nr:GntR family transcriptional regulator [uncultured Paludibaculum sp.]